MDKKKIKELWRTFGLHAVLIVLGLILLVSPDGATTLVVKLLAWILIISSVTNVAVTVLDRELYRIGKWIWSVLALGLGILLLARPLILTDLIGRVFGLIMLNEGIQNWRTGRSKALAGITIAAGIILILIPRTLTHTVLGICGVVMIIIGIINIAGKYRDMKRLEEGSDPGIIDVDIV